MLQGLAAGRGQPTPLPVPSELVQPLGSAWGWGEEGRGGRRGCGASWGNGAVSRAGGCRVCGGGTSLSQRPLCPQRLKDEIAEVTNEIENLGSTEER